MVARLRKTGIDVLGDAPWGTHFCQFYQTREDLLDILVPYFKTGLANNECCMWVTSEPLGEDEATKALRNAIPDFDGYLETGQIEVLPHTEWYLKDGDFDPQRVLNGWVDKLNGGLAAGFEGLRVTANTHWLEEADWDSFAEYEQQVNDVIGKYRMLAICSYSLDKCGAAQILDVVSSHQFALIRRAEKWAIIESSEHRRVEEALELSASRWESTFDAVEDMIAVVAADYRILLANKAMKERFEGKAVSGALCYELIHGTDHPPEACPSCRVFDSGQSAYQELQEKHLGGCWLGIAASPIKDEAGKVQQVVHSMRDITEHKQTAERLAKEMTAITNVVDDMLRGEMDDAQTEAQVLEACLAATDSLYGMIGRINEHGKWDTTTYNSRTMQDCAFPEALAWEMSTGMTIRGIWGWPVLHGEPLICNDLPAHPDRVGHPEGHVEIECFLGAPLKRDGKTVGMVAVANKRGGYTKADRDALVRLASVISISRQHRQAVVETKRASQELAAANRDLESEVAERKQAEEALKKSSNELRKTVNLMAGREVRMAELKEAIRKLREQVESAGMTPVADDPLKEGRSQKGEEGRKK